MSVLLLKVQQKHRNVIKLMKRHLLHIILLIGIVCSAFIQNIHAEQYLYTKLSKNSWQIPTARTLYKENGKYLWIGTVKGIYRFNGYDFKEYGKRDNIPNEIHGQIINHISMDAQGNLWALTNEGIGIYNRNKDIFEWASEDKITKGPFFTTSLLEDGVLLSGQNKIVFYRYSNKEFTYFKKLSDLKEFEEFEELKEQAHNIRYMYVVDQAYVVIGYANKIIRMDLKGNELLSMTCPTFLSEMMVDNQHHIWTGDFNNTLSCYNEDGKLLHRFNSKNSDLGDGLILSMEQQDSLLWIGTEGEGIYVFNTQTHQTKEIKHTRGESHSFPGNSINCLYNDAQNTMWAGSVRNGVIAIRKSLIKSYTEVHEKSQKGLSNPTVLSFYQDKNSDFVWIGTDGEGINKFNLKDRTFQHYPSTKGTKIVSIVKFDENTLLLSLYTKGLFFFNIHTGELNRFYINEKELELKLPLSKAGINLFNLSSKHILAMTDQVFKYNEQTKITEKIPFDEKVGYEIVLPIQEWNKELYFFDEAAVYKLDSGVTRIEKVYEMPEEQKIEAAAMDEAGNIWMATNHGLTFYSLKNKNLNLVQNEILKNISTIAADKEGRIWMGDQGIVFVYQHDTKHLAIFAESDGIIPNQYIEKSHFITHQGDIMLGGTQGLTVIDRNFTLDTKEIPSLVVTRIRVDDKEHNEYDVHSNKEIEIPSESKRVNIQVTSIEEDILRQKLYKYEIHGANELTVESRSPFLELHNFNPGKSEVYASCSTQSGEWTSPTLVTTLCFLPAWYESNWFYTLCGLLAIVCALLILYFVIRRKENKLNVVFKEKEKHIYEEKVKFLMNINHELRTPLTLISGPLQRIILTTSSSSSNIEALKKIYRQAERMKKLLNMILDLRKMEVGESTMHIQPVEVNNWLKEVIADFSFDDITMSPHIITDLDTRIDTVNFDKEKCEIILTNLLVNAIKHSSNEGKIVVKSEMTTDKMLQISVIDEGMGLKNLNIDKLFDRYYQGNDESQGSGIGLSYAKMLVNLHHGKIGAFNNATQGATFYFQFPLDLKAGNRSCESRPYMNDLLTADTNIFTAAPSTIGTTSSQTEAQETCRYSILIVDDNVEFTTFLKDYFSSKFQTVYLAHDGKEALNQIGKIGVDVVVSDLMMPRMNGYELCQKIKSCMEYSHIPVILLTAVNEEQNKKLGYKMGADAYIAKPFETETLYEIIKSKLRIRENIKQKYMKLSVIPEPLEDTFSQVDEKFLISLNKIIIDNIANTSLDIPFVCKEIGMSRASLYNKLKALTGMSCNEYINKIRLERAIILITTTSKSFIEIADETGFANSRYFSTSFKQNTGMSPSQYRKEHGIKKEENKTDATES